VSDVGDLPGRLTLDGFAFRWVPSSHWRKPARVDSVTWDCREWEPCMESVFGFCNPGHLTFTRRTDGVQAHLWVRNRNDLQIFLDAPMLRG
jgi:hypothetical protein